MSRRGRRYQVDDDDDAGGWGRTSSRRVNGGHSKSLSASSMTRELDDLMRIIEADWSVVMTTNVAPSLILRSLADWKYSPVETAMQLMDRSSLGRDYNAFKALYSRIERALQFVVNGLPPANINIGVVQLTCGVSKTTSRILTIQLDFIARWS